MEKIADYLPILIAIGFGVFQLFRFLGKSASSGPEAQPKPTRPPTDPFGGGSQGGNWDDLMEALGQKEKPKSSGPIPPPPLPVKIEPVVPKARTPIPPAIPKMAPEPRRSLPPSIPQAVDPEPVSKTYEFYQPKIAEASELKFKTFDSENAQDAKAIPGLSTPVLPGLHASRFRQFLSDRDRLREAVVLSEILNKPVALR